MYYLEVAVEPYQNGLAHLNVSYAVLDNWRTDRKVVQGLGREFVRWASSKPRPLHVQFNNITAREHGLFLLLKSYVEFHTTLVLEETAYSWAWVLRDPQLQDLM